MTTTTSFNFSGTNITMIATPVKKKVEKSKVVFEMGGEPIKMDNYDLDKKYLIHRDIKAWGVVSGYYFRGDPDAPRKAQYKKHVVY